MIRNVATVVNAHNCLPSKGKVSTIKGNIVLRTERLLLAVVCPDCTVAQVGNINYFACIHNSTSALLKALRDSLIHSISFRENFRKLIYIFFINSHDVSVLMCDTFRLLPPLQPSIPSFPRSLPTAPHFVSMSLYPS